MLKYILKIIKEERERIHSIMIEIIPEWIEKLEDEDLVFIKKFVLASGSLKEIAKEYDVTYPTVRLRLDRLIQKIKVCDEMDNDPYIALDDGITPHLTYKSSMTKSFFRKYEYMYDEYFDCYTYSND